jgi:hypothetical protein
MSNEPKISVGGMLRIQDGLEYGKACDALSF